MSDVVFNIAKGRVNELHDRVDGNDPSTAGLVLVLLKTAEADATLIDYDTLAALLAGSNVEADFTNYARVELTDSDISASAVDDTNNWRTADLADQTWASAGGASNNTLAKLIIGYVADITSYADSAVVPLVALDCVVTTNGGDVTVQFNAAGYFRAA